SRRSSSLSSGDGFSDRSRSSLPSSSPLLQRRSSSERESASSSPPSLSSVATASRIGVDHLFRHHLHFSSVGVVHPRRRVGVIISTVTQLRFCGNQRNPPPSAVKVLKEMLLRFTLAAKESDYFVVSKQLELEISLTLAAKESFQSLVLH
ncbi:unnamed protein product, partial [Brassica oleracea]